MDNIVNKSFENLSEFLDHVKSTPKQWLGSSKKEDYGFSGTTNIEQAIQIATDGFETERIALELSKERENHNSQVMEAVNDVSGAVVDISAFLEGIPENMTDFPLIENNKFVDILIDLCESAGTSKTVLANKAIATACLVDHLENIGYRVRVRATALNHMYAKHEFFNVCVTIKAHQEPLSIGQLAGAMHPGFFRRLIFMAYEHQYQGLVQSGYGRVMSEPGTIIKLLESMGEIGSVFLPNSNAAGSYGCSQDLHTIEGAKKWVEFFSTKILSEDGKLA